MENNTEAQVSAFNEDYVLSLRSEGWWLTTRLGIRPLTGRRFPDGAAAYVHARMMEGSPMHTEAWRLHCLIKMGV